MTPSEHYTEAERLLSEAEKIAEGSPERADRLVARAHVHALLAGSRPSPTPPAPSRPNDGGFGNRGRHNPPSPPRLHDLYE
jgi:hypothetical protein